MNKPEKKADDLSAADRLKAIDIKGADMYVFNQKHELTGETMASERFMVIRAANGRKYIFREVLDLKPKSRIIT